MMNCDSPCCGASPVRVQVRSIALHNLIAYLTCEDFIVINTVPRIFLAESMARARARATRDAPSFLEWWFSKPPMSNRPRVPGVVQDKPEPKTYFANERTFLAWLHMALTMGSIAVAMLGVSTGGTGAPVSVAL
jgi:hypothetical protein